MATTQAQLDVQSFMIDMAVSARTASGTRKVAPSPVQRTVQSLNVSDNSGELIRRISDIIDSFARLSRNGRALPVRNEDLNGWTIFDSARAMESLTATPRQVIPSHPSRYRNSR